MRVNSICHHFDYTTKLQQPLFFRSFSFTAARNGRRSSSAFIQYCRFSQTTKHYLQKVQQLSHFLWSYSVSVIQLTGGGEMCWLLFPAYHILRRLPFVALKQIQRHPCHTTSPYGFTCNLGLSFQLELRSQSIQDVMEANPRPSTSFRYD